jgi:flagellar protein FlgJ
VGPVVHTGGVGLNLRAAASTRSEPVEVLADGTALTVHCQVNGEVVEGTERRTAVWNRLPRGRYVSDAYVKWHPARPDDLPWCGQRRPARIQNEPDFVAWVAGPARQSMAKYGVPASVTIAQAILESGWGRSGLSSKDHNYFGIKCFGGPAALAIGCRSYATTECEGRKCYPTTAQFRVYSGPEDSFADHGRFLVENRRYRPAFSHTANPDRFAVELHRAGYATSPTYADSLIGLMKRFNLYRYDI